MDILGARDDAVLVETNDLCIVTAEPPTNIMLDKLIYFAEDVELGKPLAASVDVANIGGVPVAGVNVIVNGTTVKAHSFGGAELRTAETTTIDFDIPIPADMKPQTPFIISVEPSGQTDADPSDNAQTIKLGATNLSLSLTKDSSENQTITVAAKVENQSDYPATATLLIRHGAVDGEMLDFPKLDIDSRGNEVIERTFDLDAIVPEGKEYELLYFELVGGEDELYGAVKNDFVVVYANTMMGDTFNSVTVIGSYADNNGSGSYAPGFEVNINASSRSGYTFKKWSSPDNVTFADATNPVTTFTMPDANVTVTAEFAPIPAIVNPLPSQSSGTTSTAPSGQTPAPAPSTELVLNTASAPSTPITTTPTPQPSLA